MGKLKHGEMRGREEVTEIERREEGEGNVNLESGRS